MLYAAVTILVTYRLDSGIALRAFQWAMHGRQVQRIAVRRHNRVEEN